LVYSKKIILFKTFQIIFSRERSKNKKIKNKKIKKNEILLYFFKISKLKTTKPKLEK